MTFSFYEKRYTVVLPSVARDIGLVPKSQSENVIIFVCGEIFEIWSPDAWVALSNSTRLKVGLLEEDLQESEAEDSQ